MKTGQRAVVINEILPASVLPQVDYIELYNHSSNAVDISGCYLSDSPSTNKFKIPPSTVLAPRGFISFDENQLGFQLSHNGETIFFRSADGSRMLDAVQYEAQENGIAFGRYPDGSPEFYRLTAQSPGATNPPPLIDDIVINEIMFAPISEVVDDEYVELYNKGTNSVNLGGWKFTQGISYQFPPNTILLPDHYLVVAKNYTNLISHYPNLNSANTFGDFGGTLSHDGERVALGKPREDYTTNNSVIHTNTSYVVVEEVTYGTGGRWCHWANQGGSSLELIDPRSNHRLAYNWGDSDETAKATWTPFEFTGILDSPTSGNGGSGTQGGTPIDRLEVTCLGEGEFLMDDWDVRYPGNSTNLIANKDYETGLAGWVSTGNHIGTTLENSGNNGSAHSMHVRATGNGDTGANAIRSALVNNLQQGFTLTIKGYARWLRGWPEVTARIRGGYLEAYCRMAVPNNLGTPGARNSIARTNSAPAIYGVIHSPALPQVGDAVVVTAGVQDPDGIGSVNLFWRVDSASPPAFTVVAMNDNGVNGDAVAHDGIYSATIPAQAANTAVGFYVEATYVFGATNQFPANAIVPAFGDGQRHECIIRWGDPVLTLSFSTYRLWMSRNNVNAYINRPALSNQDIDGTLVVGNNRVIYNMLVHYSNSPYHQGQNTSPETAAGTSQHFDIHLPLDDKYLGTDKFNKVHSPGNGAFDDVTLQREQTAYWFARQSKLPYLYRRFVALYVNGVRKGSSLGGNNSLNEDTQRPDGELVAEFFPNETSGQLYKLQPWFEFQNDFSTLTGGGSAAFDNKLWCTLSPCLSTNPFTGPHKISRYRQNWLTRSANKTANDYTNVIAIINAANVPTNNPAYWENLSGLIDVDEWAHIFAVEHAVGNWDSVGNRNAQNMYAWKPDGGKWKLMIWDLNIVLAAATTPDTPSATATPSPNSQFLPVGNLFQTQSDQDTNGMKFLNQYPPFRRIWWRAYKELMIGSNAPFATAVNICNAKYSAMTNSGIFPLEPSSITNFINTASANIIVGINQYDYNGTYTVANPNITASSSNSITITGLANFDITDIQFNGQSWPITWTTFTNWSVTIPVTNNTSFTVVAYDKNHRVIGATNTVNVTYSIAGTPPDPRDFIVFNEIMYKAGPNNPNAEYVELYNLHTNYTFDISGWQVKGLGYTFPPASYFPPRSFIILAKDRVAFNIAYGANVPVFDEFTGILQQDGETLTLIKPAATTNDVDVVIDKVRYESTAPWSTNANFSGSSLQLIDPNQDNSRAGNWTA